MADTRVFEILAAGLAEGADKAMGFGGLMAYAQSKNRARASGLKSCENGDSMRVADSGALHKPGLGPNTSSVLFPSEHTLRQTSLTY